MKSFLEYVAHRLMGRPLSGSCWRCPFCDSPHGSLSIRPPKGDYPIKYRCFRCGAWGDEHDLLRAFNPEDDYPHRRNRLDQWRQDCERDGYSFRGEGSSPRHFQQQDYHDVHHTDPRSMEIAWAGLLEALRAVETDETFALRVLNTVKEQCDRNHVRMEALLSYWRRFDLRSVQAEIRHRYSHLPFLSWPEAAQDDYLMACAHQEAEDIRAQCRKRQRCDK